MQLTTMWRPEALRSCYKYSVQVVALRSQSHSLSLSRLSRLFDVQLIVIAIHGKVLSSRCFVILPNNTLSIQSASHTTPFLSLSLLVKLLYFIFSRSCVHFVSLAGVLFEATISSVRLSSHLVGAYGDFSTLK